MKRKYLMAALPRMVCFLALVLFAAFSASAQGSGGQPPRGKKKSKPPLNYKIVNSSRLPEGVYIKAGKIYAKKGYKFQLGKDKKILAMGTAGVTGMFWCLCESEKGECRMISYANHIECAVDYNTIPACENCVMYVSVGGAPPPPTKSDNP